MDKGLLSTTVAIIIYLFLMLVIGFYFSRTNKDIGDYYLGGRKLGPFAVAMSAEASDMSSWLLMGLPGLAYTFGLAEATYTALGLAIGTYLNWLIVSKRIRVYTQHLDVITLPQFFSRRYHDEKNLLDALAAVIIILFFIPYTASGFAACGKLFQSMFGLNYEFSMGLSAVVIMLYTTTGGFMAATMTDVIQGIVMSVALIIVMVFGVHSAGGSGAVRASAQSLPGYLSFTQIFNREAGTAQPYGILSIASMLAWGLGYFGMPHVLLRFMAIEDKERLKLSRRVATIWVVVSLAVAVLIGIVANALSQVGVLPILSGADAETSIIRISAIMGGKGVAAAFLGGIILAGILAATMSTSDSQLLAASSSASQNIMSEFLGYKMSDRQSMIVAKAVTLIIAVVAVFLAADPASSVFEIVSFAWAGFGATFGPVVLLALFWKNSNKYGAFAGMAAGAVMIMVWKYKISPMGGVWAIYELLPAFLFALLVNVLVSLLSGGASEEIKKEFEDYRAAL